MSFHSPSTPPRKRRDVEEAHARAARAYGALTLAALLVATPALALLSRDARPRAAELVGVARAALGDASRALGARPTAREASLVAELDVARRHAAAAEQRARTAEVERDTAARDAADARAMREAATSATADAFAAAHAHTISALRAECAAQRADDADALAAAHAPASAALDACARTRAELDAELNELRRACAAERTDVVAVLAEANAALSATAAARAAHCDARAAEADERTAALGVALGRCSRLLGEIDSTGELSAVLVSCASAQAELQERRLAAAEWVELATGALVTGAVAVLACALVIDARGS
ncbi:hypothetical protein KFE25_013509 [Diacronema lutheri]|uniref:Uncharacterized protein n=1 Tax=Diacronema lutheri TaxID=2081491 RepID=A0A8J6CET2_DIALT|nr:hypothetical protein KFE25_013509 [Diacronema lutheri]